MASCTNCTPGRAGTDSLEAAAGARCRAPAGGAAHQHRGGRFLAAGYRRHGLPTQPRQDHHRHQRAGCRVAGHGLLPQRGLSPPCGRGFPRTVPHRCRPGSRVPAAVCRVHPHRAVPAEVPARLAVESRQLVGRHLARRPLQNPIDKFAARFAANCRGCRTRGSTTTTSGLSRACASSAPHSNSRPSTCAGCGSSRRLPPRLRRKISNSSPAPASRWC